MTNDAVTPQDRIAMMNGYKLLTPAAFHSTELNLISWECPTCGAVVARGSAKKHAQWHADSGGWVA